MKQTPSQTVGPYFAYGLSPEQYLYDFKSLVDNQLVNLETEHICIRGRVFDGNGQVIPDAMIELWDSQNKLFGRFGTGTEADNSFVFYTKKPSQIGSEAPFLTLIVFMRGQLLHAYTRVYFSDEAANTTDLILQNVAQERRHTLIAQKKANHYLFNIYMQGENETVFFDI